MTPIKPIFFSLLFFNESTLSSPPFTIFLLLGIILVITILHVLSETQLHVRSTLSQLKELAFIKSSFNSLKYSISSKSLFDFEVVSRKAMDLLLKLDSIQGGDPMIRDGRRSVTKDLVRFLEFIDGFAVKRHERSCNSARNVRVLGKSNNARILNAKNDYGGYGNLIENPRSSMGIAWNQNGSLVFSAPVPVKMESRADLMKKRKAVKIVT
ncbi:hypothetical protein NC652_011290 [Populus alba x Populus x berolinensis]|nr:hypothetical protein NC652_011290 [Populus alba x Populus x berolinensis]KAJ7000864.1 hypothetical protein NC653_011348 [Populus alba x Populus x berolinensis]